MAIMPGENVVLSKGGSAVAQVTSISGPNVQRQTIETTNLDSTAREFRVSTLRDGGELTFEVYYDANTHDTLYSSMDDATASAWTLAINGDSTADGSSTWSFSAFTTGYELGSMEVDGNVSASITLKITGKPTVA